MVLNQQPTIMSMCRGDGIMLKNPAKSLYCCRLARVVQTAVLSSLRIKKGSSARLLTIPSLILGPTKSCWIPGRVTNYRLRRPKKQSPLIPTNAKLLGSGTGVTVKLRLS